MKARGAFALPKNVYLDTATWGLPPIACADAIRAALDAQQAGEADWIRDWDRPAESCRSDFASLIGAAPSDIALLPASSVGVGLVAERLAPGEEVVVAADEFTSVLFPILVAERWGAVVHQVPFDELAERIAPGTRLVAFSLVQMQTGKVARLVEILAAASAAGAEVLVDATQATPFVDVAPALGRIDYLVCSAYKHLLSPRGVAFMYVRADHHGELEPLNANWRAADDPYGRFFGGPLTLRPGAARFDVSLAWLPWLGARESLRLLVGWKRDGTLAAVPALARVLAEEAGTPPTGATLVCVPVPDAERARAALEAAGIRASVRGTSVRFAPHVYNDEDDVARAAKALRRVAAVHA